MTVMGSDAALWHQRLGHMSKKGLEVMLKRDQLPGLQSANLEFCEHCLYGKQKQVSFLKDGHNLKEKPLELVHLDIFGPVEVSSLGGAKNLVTFLDDCTRKVWIYLMANKSEGFSKFKVFKALVENQRDHKIKCLKSDNGGEFCSLEFNNFCADNSICRVKVVPYTPQENGAAERLNRTIMEKARCMLSNAVLEKEFWVEACNTAVYLINRSPSRLNFGISEEEWQGRRISYSHLKVFGCQAFAHVPQEKRSKLDPKSEPCIFVGYGEDQFGFRLWSLTDKKTIRSRDVVFNEKTFPALHSKEMSEKEFVPISAQRNVGVNPQTVPNTISYSPTSVLFPNLSSSFPPGNTGHDDSFSQEFFDISSQDRNLSLHHDQDCESVSNQRSHNTEHRPQIEYVHTYAQGNHMNVQGEHIEPQDINVEGVQSNLHVVEGNLQDVNA